MQQLLLRLLDMCIQCCKMPLTMPEILKRILLVKRIQQTEFDEVMLINGSASNNPMRQQRCANIACYKCGQKGITQKTS